jgi:BASS family bile acid:Na+ symporter
MKDALARTASIAILVFSVSSMLSVGLAYRLREVIAPLRQARAVFRALVANFALVPLLAVGIERLLPIDPQLALGLFLVAGAAGTPFLITLTSAARSDLVLGAALLLLLIPATVVFLPFYVPLAMAHPSLRGLSYVPASTLQIGLPLLTTLILPLLVGLAGRAVAPRWAIRIVPLGGIIAKVALVVVMLAIFGANVPELARIVETGAVVAPLLLTLGGFAAGYLLSRPERSAVLGLGTAQRNIAGAMVIAAQGFTDPDILVMVTACALVGLLVLFPIAWLLGRRAPDIGPPTPEEHRMNGSPLLEAAPA